MMMRMQERVVAGGVAIQLEFADETGFHQGMERVVDGGARCADVALIQGGPEFVHGGVIGMPQQVIEDGDPLRCAAEAGGPKGLVDSMGWIQIRHRSKIRLSSNVALPLESGAIQSIACLAVLSVSPEIPEIKDVKLLYSVDWNVGWR